MLEAGLGSDLSSLDSRTVASIDHIAAVRLWAPFHRWLVTHIVAHYKALELLVHLCKTRVSIRVFSD